MDTVVPHLDFLYACHLGVKVSKQAMYIVSWFDVYSVSVAENIFSCKPVNSHFSFKGKTSPLLKEKPKKNDCFYFLGYCMLLS